MKCATHPKVETNLRCGKCGKPICPKCMVQTPVGARCRDCAQLYRLPIYQVPGKYYLRASAVALGLAIVSGVIWWAVDIFLFFYLSIILAAGIGYAIGEVVSLSVNRKRSPWLAAIAGLGVAISYLVSALLPGGFVFGLRLLFDLIAVALGIYIAVARLR